MTTLTDLMAANAKLAKEAMVGRLDENIPALCARLTVYREALEIAIGLANALVHIKLPDALAVRDGALAEIAAKLGGKP